MKGLDLLSSLRGEWQNGAHRAVHIFTSENGEGCHPAFCRMSDKVNKFRSQVENKHPA